MSLLNNLPETGSYSREVKFYIKDTAGKWVDFSDRSNTSGVNALVSIGDIKNKVEANLGSLVTTIQSIVLNNESGIFNGIFPSTVKNTEGSAASFSSSKKSKRTIFRGLECKVTVQTSIAIADHANVWSRGATPPNSIQEDNLGYFYIDDIAPNFTKKTITLRLISKDGKLNKKDADKVKNGYDWYRYQPVSTLIETIVESELGTLGSGANIDRSPNLDTVDGTNAMSTLGRPPLWDGSSSREDGFFTRAICYANVNSGGSQRIEGNVLYLGCDNQLWAYNDTTALYTWIYTFTGSNTIKKIFYDSVSDNLVIVLWEDEYWGDKTVAQTRTGWDFEAWRYGNDSGTDPIECTSGTNYLTSLQYFVRPPGFSTVGVSPSGNENVFTVGQFSDATDDNGFDIYDKGENIFIPFDQHVQMANSFYLPSSTVNAQWSTVEKKKSSITLTTPLTNRTGFQEGYYFQRSGTDQYFTFIHGDSWASFLNGARDDDTNPMCNGAPVIYYVGQEPCVMISDRQVTSKLYMYYFTFDMATEDSTPAGINMVSSRQAYTNTTNEGWFKLNCHSVNDSTQTTQSLDLGLDTSELENCVPTCMKVSPASANAFIFFQEFLDTTSDSACKVSRLNLENVVNWSSSSPIIATNTSLFGSETGSNKHWTVINCEFFSSNPGSNSYTDKNVLILYNRETGKYALAFSDSNALGATSTLYTTATILDVSSTPFRGLVQDTVDDCVYAFSCGTGKIVKITNGGVYTSLNSTPAVSHEFGLMSNLTVNNSHTASEPQIYGVSSPAVQPEIFYNYVAGKHLLFRFSQSISDLVEYADFDGLSKMEAVKLLTQSRNGLSFFDRNGELNFLPRVHTSGTANYTFGGFSNTSSIFKSIALDYGYKNIHNYINVNTYGTKYEAPDPKALTILDRSAVSTAYTRNAKEIGFADYSITQRDDKKKKVFAYCIKGGTIESGNSRWKYSIISDEVEATLSSAYNASASTLSVSSVFGGDVSEDGVHTGDFVSVIDPDTGTSYISTITAISGTDLTILPTIPVDIPQGTTAMVSKAFRSGTSTLSEWSDEGVAYVTTAASSTDTTVELNSVENVGIGCIIRFGADSVYEYRITAINYDTNEVSITREEDRQTGKIDQVIDYDTNNVYLVSPQHTLVTGDYVKVTGTEWYDTASAYVTATTNAIRVGITYVGDVVNKGVWEKVLATDGLNETTIAVGTKVLAYYSPQEDESQEIGGSKIFVAWYHGNGIAGLHYLNNFIYGDRLVINCPGLSLVQSDSAKQIAIDGDSVNLHEKIETTIDNRFMSLEIGKDMSKRLLRYYSQPKFHITITVPLLPDVDIVTDGALTLIDVEHPEIFPTSLNFKEQFVIESIKHNLKSMMTTFKLVGIDSY